MRDGHRAAAPWQVVGCMAMERRTDAALLRAAREADPEAFGAFYARHVDGLVPDGVAFVRPRKGTRRVRVQDNFFVYDRPAHDDGRPLWFDADGAPISTGTRRGHRGPLGLPISRSRVRLTTVDGRSTTIARLLDARRTVVAFTASWCGPCRQDAGHLRRLEAAGVPVIAIAQDDRLRDLARTLGPDVLLLRDARGELTRLLGANGLPDTFLLDRDTGIVEHRRGALGTRDVETILSAAKG